MFLTLAGGLLALLGLLSGLLLVGAPFGLGPAAPGLVIWLLFPLFTVVGYVLVVMGSKSGAAGVSATRAVAGALLLLAVAAAVALFARAAGMGAAQGHSLGLWYVLVLAGAVGGLGTAAVSRRADPDA